MKRHGAAKTQKMGLNQARDLALRCLQAGRLAEAETLYRKILEVRPKDPCALHFLGVIARQSGQFVTAAELMQKAIALKPDYAEAHGNLGALFQALGRSEEALAAYRRVLALQPDRFEAHNNLGMILQGRGELEGALAAYRRAAGLKPDCAEAHYNLGTVLQALKRREEAVAAYRRALALRPDCAEALSALTEQLLQQCDWSQLPELVERQRRLVNDSALAAVSPFSFRFLFDSAAEQQRCARKWAAARLGAARNMRDGMEFQFPRHARKKLRIGYLSADFRRHPTAFLLAELIELHDRGRFEIFAYSTGPDDGSDMRRRLSGAFDRFTDIRALSFADAARRIYADGVDILVDLMGWSKGCRPEILALRPAPVQVSFLGYVGTMGVDFIDYLIADRFAVPQAQAPYFDERPVWMPDCYQVNDRKRPLPAIALNRADCGLPEQGFVFCCFVNANRIAPQVFAVWMRLLHALPGSVLWLLEAEPAAGNLRREAKRCGVAPERLVFAPRRPLDEYLAYYRLADLFLDTLPCNAHTTASDALWAGCPLLSCAGESFAARTAGSLLRAIGLPEMVVSSLEEYEASALRLAQAPAILAALRQRLQQNRRTAPLFDTPRFTRHLEAAFQTMWEIYAANETPRGFTVAADGG